MYVIVLIAVCSIPMKPTKLSIPKAEVLNAQYHAENLRDMFALGLTLYQCINPEFPHHQWSTIEHKCAAGQQRNVTHCDLNIEITEE